jgi:hypothetical protein
MPRVRLLRIGRLAPDDQELLAQQAPNQGGLEVERNQRRMLREPRARRVRQKARDDTFDLVIRLHQALFQ